MKKSFGIASARSDTGRAQQFAVGFAVGALIPIIHVTAMGKMNIWIFIPFAVSILFLLVTCVLVMCGHVER